MCIVDEGASPLFSPHKPDEVSATAALLEVVRRDPHLLGIERNRWDLANLLQCCDWLRLQSLAGLWRLLDRLGISYKRGRPYVHSPDPHYLAKQKELEQIKQLVASEPERLVLLYLDEVTLYRQPTLASNYEAKGHIQPKAPRSYQSDYTLTRIIASLNGASGQVEYLRATKIGLEALVGFYQQIRAAYPHAERIYVVEDNWPVHFHPNVLVALEPQESHWPKRLMSNWPSEPSEAAQKHWGALHLPIQLVQLPTYASWLNPIEKLWRKLNQEMVHLHRLADKVMEFRHSLDHFLDKFAAGSRELLRYVGLGVPN